MNSIYKFEGIVIKGAKRGKDLGFPTANILLSKKIPEGIYASIVLFDGKEYIAATFIGGAKTFGEEDYKAESYILNFDQDIYGELVTAKLFKKLRRNKKFDNQEELVKQMKKDVSDTLSFFTQHPVGARLQRPGYPVNNEG